MEAAEFGHKSERLALDTGASPHTDVLLATTNAWHKTQALD
jgi:hypothetical protein